MKVLFYIEPKIEFNNPYFRLATIRSSLIPQISAFLSHGHQTHLIFGSHLIQPLINQNLEKKLGEYSTISDSDLSLIFGNYQNLARWGLEPNFEDTQFTQISQLISGSLPDSFQPDLIIVWETAAEYLRKMFPSATIIYQVPGPFSRPPFPAYTMVLPRLLEKIELTLNASPDLDGAQNRFRDSVRGTYFFEPEVESFVRNLRTRFKSLILFPLQVDNYFMIDGALNYQYRQFDCMTEYLASIPKDCGVIFTGYKSRDVKTDTLNDKGIAYLREQYPNFIFDEKINAIENVSQFILPEIDGVVSISSSVGFQAALWEKPLLMIGRSHIAAAATASNLSSFLDQVVSRKVINQDIMLSKILTEFSFENSLININSSEFVNFLSAWPQSGNDADVLNSSKESRAFEALSLNMRPTKRISKSPTAKVGDPTRILYVLSSKRETVCFDIFDTLLVRPFASPADLFGFMEPNIKQYLGSKSINFIEPRKPAERRAFQFARERGRGEINIDEIYVCLSQALSLEPEQSEWIKNLEIQLELKFLYPRKSIKSVFDYCISNDKTTYLISDMYLSTDKIYKILSDNNVSGFEKLFLSSQYGEKKQSGKLWEIVLNETNVQVEKALHIGDNPIGDLQRPKELGIKAAHVSKTWENFKNSLLYKSVWQRDEERHSLSLRTMLSIIANDSFDEFGESQKSRLFPRGRYDLGFIGLGPMILSYVHWLINRSKKDGVESLFFLSRDGWIIKQAYDLVAKHDPSAPKSIYLYCSRRCANVAKLKTEDDIEDLFHVDIGTMTVERFIEVRFGLTYAEISSDKEVLNEIEKIRGKKINNKSKFEIMYIIKRMSNLILKNAEIERNTYLKYLHKQGFTNEANKAVVDIGYAGTMQQSLYQLLGEQAPFPGYYVVTFRTALERCEKLGLETNGFLGEFIDRHDTHLEFCRFVPLYESLFSNSDPSLMCFREARNGELIPCFQDSSPREYERSIFALAVHNGALDYVRAFSSVFQEFQFQFDLEPAKSYRTLSVFFSRPNVDDAKLLEGLEFEDYYGGGKAKTILTLRSEPRASSVWKQGEVALRAHGERVRSGLGWRAIFKPVVRPIVKKLGKEKDVKMFNEDPINFFDTLPLPKYKYERKLGLFVFRPLI